MQASRLEVRCLRIIGTASLDFVSTWNVIIGPNGSGKTSLLEALHLCGSGRSFRTHRTAELIQTGSRSLSVSVQYRDSLGERPSIALERSDAGLQISIGGKVARGTAEIARSFPIITITPLSHALIDGDARERRRFLDWFLFHVEPEYLSIWRHYHRALRQRNVLLRARSDRTIETWEREMVSHGKRLHELRVKRVAELAALFARMAGANGLSEVDLHYVPGWAVDISFEEQLRIRRLREMDLGHTQFGPHRADLLIQASGRPAATYWSRGQSKLGAASLALAQADLIAEVRGQQPLLLMDDFGAELDASHRAALFELASQGGRQVIATATERSQIPANTQIAVFHVERGKFQKAV
jgi:DNA replication and repair protein RecF